MNRKQLTIALIEENFKAVDQLANTLVLGLINWLWHMIVGHGKPSFADETVSARTGRAYKNGKVLGKIFRPLIDILFVWQSNEYKMLDGSVVVIESHCERARLKELHKRGLPSEYQDQPASAGFFTGERK
jgi:hypothetical protein